tara:strand:- start:2071 stop:2418 length:348 start_codon:yes stop_codon:yes gene_type:complete
LTKDQAILKSLDGLRYEDEEFSDYLYDGEETSNIADHVTGGVLSFEYDIASGSLIGSVEYQLSRALSSDEVAILKEYTIEQLLDGIGSNFSQERGLDGQATPFINHEQLSFEQTS